MKTKTGLRYWENGHRYQLDGKHVPSVTAIGDVRNKPGMPRWSATSVAEFVADNPEFIHNMLDTLDRDDVVNALKGVPWSKSKKAGARGTALHDIAEKLLRGEAVNVPEQLAPVVENALLFLEEWSIEPVLIEQIVASREHWYAGKLDHVSDFVHPVTGQAGRGIFDWKSGKKVYAAAVFQLNGYGGAEFYQDGDTEKPMSELGITTAWGVHIREDDYDVNPLPYGPDIFEEFLAHLRLYLIDLRAEGDWKVPGSGYVGLPVGTEPLEAVS